MRKRHLLAATAVIAISLVAGAAAMDEGGHAPSPWMLPGLAPDVQPVFFYRVPDEIAVYANSTAREMLADAPAAVRSQAVQPEARIILTNGYGVRCRRPDKYWDLLRVDLRKHYAKTLPVRDASDEIR